MGLTNTIMYCTDCAHKNDDQAKLCASCGIEFQIMIEEPAIQASLNNSVAMQYTAFWRRLIAAVVDGAILYFGVMALYTFFIFLF